MANAGKKMGRGSQAQHGAKGAGSPSDTESPDETDLDTQIAGRNSLQGNDQSNVHNQRQSQAGVKKETDDIVESLEKLDKDHRAREDLGKGNRASGNRSGDN